MKPGLTIVLLLVWLLSSAQTHPAELAEKITARSKTDKEKVTAIFQWITSNIAYKTPPRNFYGAIGKTSRRFIKEESAVLEDDDAPLLLLNDRVAINVIKRGTAVCEGYTRLFQSLCDYAGVRSVIVPGFARGNAEQAVRRFAVNHYWNAVCFDSAWHLLDVTWASGYINAATGEFVQEYNSRYFLTPPDQFVQDHYPDDQRWTLLSGDKIPEEFRRSPFLQKSFSKYGFTSFSPGKGIIEVSVGDTITLELEAKHAGEYKISPSTMTDSTLFTHSPSWIFLKPHAAAASAAATIRYQYTYTVSSAHVQWLYLMYNDDIVLRYRLKVRSGKS
jgi:transglutaminase/protease-like cytokinesis protein 3